MNAEMHILLIPHPNNVEDFAAQLKEWEALLTREIRMVEQNDPLFDHPFQQETCVIIDGTREPDFAAPLIRKIKVEHSDVNAFVVVLNGSGTPPSGVKGIHIVGDCHIAWPHPLNNRQLADCLKERMARRKQGLQEEINICFESSMEYLFKVNNMLANHICSYCNDEDMMVNLRLTLDELGTNAVRHGNRNDPSKIVQIHVRRFDSYLTVRIHDQGPGFDVTKIPDPTADDRILLPSGRGIFIARQLMHSVQYHEKGNTVEFRQNLYREKVSSSAELEQSN